MDRLARMHLFVRVVELGSFVRASEELGIGRPTATDAVASLEKHLGVRLLHRTTRKLSLTEDGRAYYERCLRILADIAEAEDAASTARASPRGRLRVSIPHSFIYFDFFPQLPRFLRAHPDLQVELVITDRAVNLAEEGIDCAVRAVPIPDDSTLVARRIAGAEWVTCASPAYLKANGKPREVRELERHNCIRFISPSRGRVLDFRFEDRGQKLTFTPRGNLGVTSLEAAAMAAQGGIGIAQVPEDFVRAAIRAKRLVNLLPGKTAPAPPMCVVYPSNRYLSAKVRVFADFAADVFDNVERMASKRG
jgi:LysR family transcriptional regulator for bpeEF and oprC